jgi:hypothetical protein
MKGDARNLNYHVFQGAYKKPVRCDGLGDRYAPQLRWACN